MFTKANKQKNSIIFQYVDKVPPEFPRTINNKYVWDEINYVDQAKLEDYVARIILTQTRERHNKKRQLDEIDCINENTCSTKSIKLLAKSSASSITEAVLCTYWSNPEAKILFCPEDDELVQDCLLRRRILLNEAIFNNDCSLLLLDHIADIRESGSKQRQKLQMDCVYLRKLYEYVLQYTNKLTWKQLLDVAIK